MSGADVSWQIQGTGANLKCGPLEGYAGCTPDGFTFIVERWSGKLAEGISVLCSSGPDERELAEPMEIGDQYVRGQDFVASYQAVGPQRIAPHIYWRALFDRSLGAAQIELVLSAQTDLLDSGPSWELSSLVVGFGSVLFHTGDLSRRNFEEISTAGRHFDATTSREHLFVFRIESLGLSYAQMVHPSDFSEAKVAFVDGQPFVLDTTLFSERLEKGVIRRGRICGWFMPAENDLETAVALARQFVDEPLPLTA